MEKVRQGAASVGCWSGGYVGQAVFQSQPGKESGRGIKAILVFPVALFHLAIVSGRVRTDQFMANAQLSSSFLKQGSDISFAVGEAAGKLKAIVCLGTFHADSPAVVPLH